MLGELDGATRNGLEDGRLSAVRKALWPGGGVVPPAGSRLGAILLPMYAQGARPRPGTLWSDELDVDSHWHFHDMHQLMFAFEGAIEVESERGRHLIPRQLAAWIPAGAPHRASIHRVRFGSVFFTEDMVDDAHRRIRTVLVSPLMREMMREALRWPLHGPETPLRADFLRVMARLCGEWIDGETDLFLPARQDPRLQRALDYTAQKAEAKLPEVCAHAGMSERSLRRHLKAETGMTWEALRHRSRLLQAIARLSETAAPITDIAAGCGFESPSAFAKAFRLAMGESPSAYRSRLRDLA